MDEALTMAARQLLKSRLRRHIFETKLAEAGDDERIWRGMLVLEEAIQEEALERWHTEIAKHCPSEETLLRVLKPALYAAARGVLKNLEDKLDESQLERLVSEYILSFQPQWLTNGREIPKC